MVGMLKDQPFNQVDTRHIKTRYVYQGKGAPQPFDLDGEISHDSMQDGMLSYYLSQVPFTEEHESGVMAREYFNLRDMLEPKK
jgi:hypothetical protein